jgi:hypothetical protein
MPKTSKDEEDDSWIWYESKTRDEKTTHTLYLKMKSGKRFIRACYDLAYNLFDMVNLLPFVVCVSGALGGRALTLKDSKHNRVLTDQYTEAGPSWRHANQIQRYGRLCSVDTCNITRTLWCPEETKDMLWQAVKFEEEARRLYIEHNNGSGLEFKEAIMHLTTQNYPVMVQVFQEPKLIAQPRIIAEFSDEMIEAAELCDIDTGRGKNSSEKTLYQIALAVLSETRVPMTPAQIVEYALARGWYQTTGRTPELSMHSELSTAMRKEGESCPFVHFSEYEVFKAFVLRKFDYSAVEEGMSRRMDWVLQLMSGKQDYAWSIDELVDAVRSESEFQEVMHQDGEDTETALAITRCTIEMVLRKARRDYKVTGKISGRWRLKNQ